MGPNSFRKIVYSALIVLMFGVTTGWLGGLQSMAKKFGGQFSPDGDTFERGEINTGAYEKVRVDPMGARSNLLFIPAIPLVFMSLNEGAVALIVALISAVMLTLAAWLLRGGLTLKQN